MYSTTGIMDNRNEPMPVLSESGLMVLSVQANDLKLDSCPLTGTASPN
jgi:hypothetical protein